MIQKQSTYDLSGKIALVTGAARGIGQACALALAESGADIILGLRNKESGAELADKIKKTGRKVLPVQMDVSQMTEIKAAVKEGYDPETVKKEVLDLCRENLPPYAVPRYVEFRDEFPFPVTEKIFKRKLREQEIERMKKEGLLTAD